MAAERIRIMLMVPMLHQGGFERICALTAQLLKDRYDVHLVVFSTEDMFYDVSGIDMTDLNLGAVPGILGKACNILKRVKRVKELKKKLNIQITYSFGQTANIVNALSKVNDTTWVGIRGFGSVSNRKEMGLICRFADRVISCTRVMEEIIDRQYRVKKGATLYNPCNLEEIYRLSKEPATSEMEAFLQKPGKTIVSMGREDDLKGFWHLIKSVAILIKTLPDTRLMIIGDGEYREYKELAANLGISDSVMFTGVQKNPFAILAKADVYALTSDSEGFPNALIEAMAVGLPCISVNCKTGPAEILSADYTQCADEKQVYEADYGILTPVFTGTKNLDAGFFTEEESIFAKELEKMLTDAKRMDDYSQKGKQRAADFGMEAYVQAIDRLMNKDIG